MSEVIRCVVDDEILDPAKHKVIQVCTYSGCNYYHKHCWLAKNEKFGVELE